MFFIFIYVFACFLNATYMQIGANECNCMLHCTSIKFQMIWLFFLYLQRA